ncbi:MAG: AmmeMemoRadiSam system radical SAM enzyme [Lentisphaeria bacterium]|nr:AmmeMemoRadiSam system radical SAM enzyme [Lentisphaeria bacterium]
MIAHLVESVPGRDKTVRCLACAHRCVIPEGGHGRCSVRVNVAGHLLVPGGEVSALAADPVEKKPLYHFFPGATTLSFGMEGCSFTCGFCQNWRISQRARHDGLPKQTTPRTAEQIVTAALRSGLTIITSTYNEPLISSEWAVEIFTLARQHGLKTAFVTNGFASPEAVDFLAPRLDAVNVDLKCFTEENYRSLGGRLAPVLETLDRLREREKWVEVTTLVVPGFNDSDEELTALARHLAQWNPDAPWHVSAYHESYHYHAAAPRTPMETITRAIAIGKAAGLRFVYSGNLPPGAEQADTFCPACGTVLITRRGFTVTGDYLTDGACPNCGAEIPGVWR